MADKAIEVLLDEKRNFPPPKEFKKSANVKSASVFNTARKNPQAFWAKAAKELHWFKPWKKVLEWNSPWAKWFIGGKLNASYNCLDRHVQFRAEEQGGDHLGRRARRRARADLPRRVARGKQVRQRAQKARRQKRRPGLPLHGHGSRAGHRHARLQPHRRAAQRGVRRLQRRSAA